MTNFYTTFADYYDEIFPLKEQTLSFLKSYMSPGDRVLDLASGTGTYAVELFRDFTLVATDISEAMVSIMKNKEPDLDARELSMEETDQLDGSFDVIYCIGNSLVHLEDEDAIKRALKTIHKKLNPGGRLIIQIINYDRILDQKIKSLPTLHNDAKTMTFERDYLLDEDHILFKTTLRTPEGVRYNTNHLFPMRKDELLSIFKTLKMEVEIFGSFGKDPFNIKESQPLIAVARK